MERQRAGVAARWFVGREREAEYWRTVEAVGEPMVSPGGAAAELRCSREYIAKLIRKGRLRAWFYKASERATRASYCMIPWSDVKAYAQAVGRGEPVGGVDGVEPGVLG